MDGRQTRPGPTAEQLGEVRQLQPDSSGTYKLEHETIVLCCNRGREVVRDTFNSQHFQMEPGFFTVKYAAALHLQRRAVVPGSRNPETGFQASFIVILCPLQDMKAGSPNPLDDVTHPIDDQDQWAPFTDEVCREFGHAVEALDRANMTDPIDSDIVVVTVPGQGYQAGSENQTAGSRVKSGTVASGKAANGRRSVKATRLEGNTELLKNKNAAGTNEAIEQIAHTRAEQAAHPND